MKTTTVLIVDDETNIRLMLRTTLETAGYRVQQAVDGREALKAIERETPDVMILDLSMPVLDGMGVLQELKNVRPEKKPRVIVLTAYGSIATAVKATRLGAMDFLEKPISPDEVRESVDGVLAEPLPRPQLSDSDDPLSGGYAGVLNRVRKAMRLTNYADAGNIDRLYEEALNLLETVNFDVQLAGAELLGRDVAALCGEQAAIQARSILALERNRDRLVLDMVRTSAYAEAVPFIERLLAAFWRGLLHARS